MKQRDDILRMLAEEYNNPIYFTNDPIIFPKHFLEIVDGKKITLKDVEIAGIIAAHLAWGRRDMIVRDTKRALDQMNWQPYRYIMEGKYKDSNDSLHRTIKWSEFAKICTNLRAYFSSHDSIEPLTPDQIRVQIYGQESNPKMANKKIHMFRRWMVRNDHIVDLGIWKESNPADLIIPLDVHVHRSATELKITERKSCDFKTALQITEYLKKLFPLDPCLGDFALFAYAATNHRSITLLTE